MHSFRDCDGREWLLKVNVYQLKRVKASLGLDLVGLLADGFQGLGGLLNDPPALVDVLYLLCQEEADGRQVSDEAFGRAMAGDALEKAAAAFTEELVDFFPAQKQAPLRAALGKLRQLDARAAQEAAREAEALDVEEMLRAFLARRGGTSGGAPGSSASTPAPSPSGS